MSQVVFREYPFHPSQRRLNSHMRVDIVQIKDSALLLLFLLPNERRVGVRIRSSGIFLRHNLVPVDIGFFNPCDKFVVFKA